MSGEVPPNEPNDILHSEDVSTSSVITENNEHATMQCGEGFATIDNRNSRKGRKLFSCHMCNYTFTRKQHLTNHIRTHTGERPFSCDQCDYTCVQKSALTSHLRTHTGERPFSCDVCGKLFARSSSLNQHKQIHTHNTIKIYQI